MSMAEEGSESRFVCKLCSKKFSCGKSLGGHMRSHVVANSAEFHEKVELEARKDQFLNESKFAAAGNGQPGYVLRENPRKTWRAADARPPLLMEKVCKQCGKGFQSMKALCGHMASHSDKERGTKDDHSWTSENPKMVCDRLSETDSEERKLRTRPSKSRRCKKFAEDSPSSVSEIDGQEQEEMAKCLMMLSRDSCNKFEVNSVVESSDNNSVVMETKSSSIEMRKEKRVDEKYEAVKMEASDSDSGYFLDECAKGESEVSVDWFRKSAGFSERFSERKRPQISLKLIKSSGNAYDDDDDDDDDDNDNGDAYDDDGMESRKRKYGSGNQEFWNGTSRMVKNGGADPHKKSKYECFNCKKAFKSYQALGGHRPCHKRSNAYGESGENSPDSAAAYYRSNPKFVESSSKNKESAKSSSHFAEKKSKNKNKAHVCPFCDRVFKNGQALGGHKRSHFLTGHDESSSRSLVEKPDLLDLNLPAPEADEEEGGGHFFSW